MASFLKSSTHYDSQSSLSNKAYLERMQLNKLHNKLVRDSSLYNEVSQSATSMTQVNPEATYFSEPGNSELDAQQQQHLDYLYY